MPFDNAESLLKALIAATTSDEYRKILEEIGDHGNVELDEPFGPFTLAWHPFGNNESNNSSINLATKPGRSLTERITNAMDAILEDRARDKVALPQSARDAAQQWFGRPITSSDNGLFNWDYAAGGYDRRIAVVITPSGVKAAPTIDVIDEGIGISPEAFPQTILSLQSGNKIKKLHVMGAFGQGGASTLAFCDYALIVSRHRDNPKVVGFTVIRVAKLGGGYKEDCYAYISIKQPSDAISVPSCQLDEGPLPLYASHESANVPELRHGTLVRHVTYKLPKLDGSLSPSTGNLYTYLQCSVFDPLLPFRVFDLRAERPKREIILGSRNRLMKLTLSEAPATPNSGEETGTEIRHHREMEYLVPPGSQDATVGVEYWVALNYRKSKKPGGPPELRAQSHDLYVQPGYPIVGTLNGQNQGELGSAILREIGLGMVARHIVIHMDATRADSRVRRELFSSTREGFKDGTILTGLTQLLEKMLKEDSTLYEIERELTERLAKREAQSTSEDVKRQVVKLLQEWGLQIQDEGPTTEPAAEGEGGKDKATAKAIRKGKPRKLNPLPTLPFPEVTKFKIVFPQTKMDVRINDSEVVIVETDADFEYGNQKRLGIRFEPSCLEEAGNSPLRGGRVRWRLRPRATAKAGDIGRIIVTITKPDGTQLTDSIDFEVLPSLEVPGKKAKGFVPPFEIVAINPIDDTETWNQVWPELPDDSSAEMLASVACKPLRVGGGITVYYSTVFAPFHEQMEKLKTDSPALPELFRANYEVWIGYHAIIQDNSRKDATEGLDDEIVEKMLAADRNRVALMQVKQAKSTADLMHKAKIAQEGD